ncbi:MAG TPA: hypothetical protein EYP53_05705 [Candidatus Latescibacteria bacterium]|nr:hypothetical protein [Candidatus Latescibacterota bacterium]
MITILIADDEERIQATLTRILRQEGYSVQENWNRNGVIKMVKKGTVKEIASLKDTIIELESSLYRQREGMLYRSILQAVEKPLLEHVLERTGGNQLKAARILGINRNTLRAKIRKLGIEVRKSEQRVSRR